MSRHLYGRITQEARLLGVAIQFLTRIPIRFAHFDPAWLHASARYFPATGMLIGGIGAAMLMLASQFWPIPLAVLISMVATIVLTGAFHEDGLADTCDALGGAVSRERALEIMKDSRIGTYGAAGLMLVLAMKALFVWNLAEASMALAAGALLVAHTLSRGVTVALLCLLPYAGDPEHAKAKPMAQQVSLGSVLFALAFCALAVVAMVYWVPVRPAGVGAALLAAMLFTWLWMRWLRRRLGGYTGDTLGAAQQIVEVVIYAALSAQPLHA